MKFRYLALGVMALGGAAGFFWPAQADVPLPMDNPISIDGVQTVCTGIGDEAQHDPRWLAFPILHRIFQWRCAISLWRACRAVVFSGQAARGARLRGALGAVSGRAGQLQGDRNFHGRPRRRHSQCHFSPPSQGPEARRPRLQASAQTTKLRQTAKPGSQLMGTMPISASALPSGSANGRSISSCVAVRCRTCAGPPNVTPLASSASPSA